MLTDAKIIHDLRYESRGQADLCTGWHTIPAFTKPMTMTVVAPELWMAAVPAANIEELLPDDIRITILTPEGKARRYTLKQVVMPTILSFLITTTGQVSANRSSDGYSNGSTAYPASLAARKGRDSGFRYEVLQVKYFIEK